MRAVKNENIYEIEFNENHIQYIDNLIRSITRKRINSFLLNDSMLR